MSEEARQIKLGIIGYGYRLRHMATLIKRLGNAKVIAICDTNPEAAKTNARELEDNFENIMFTDSADRLIKTGGLDGILIGTNCSSHTEIAVKVLNANIPLFLEKPVSINDEQLGRLKKIAQKKQHKVVVSFPLRLTPLAQKVKKIIDSGRIGKVQQVQAFNDVPYGHVYFQSWYRDNKETGGLFLQKATHDFDYINYLIDQKPILIAAMISKQIYKGEHQPGLYCRDCSENQMCKESPYNKATLQAKDEWMKPEQYLCAFAPDAANEDSGSAIIMYDSGMHVVYSQNFFVKHKAGRRGARLYGYDGTIEFDWHTNQIKIFDHHTAGSETIDVSLESDQGHGGGDEILGKNFIDVILGRGESTSTLEDGILSAEMCLRAKESALTNTFQDIKYNKHS